VELSIPYLRQLAEEQPALGGLLLKNESKPDFSPPYDAAAVEEVILREAVEAVEEAEEEHRLLCSPRPRLRQLSHKQLTSEPWGPPPEYSRETEPRQMTSSTNSGIIIVSTEESLDLTPP
jgi:hypothetical protein